jgi:hypothetical protein
MAEAILRILFGSTSGRRGRRRTPKDVADQRFLLAAAVIGILGTIGLVVLSWLHAG